jgi:hypothetical protein
MLQIWRRQSNRAVQQPNNPVESVGKSGGLAMPILPDYEQRLDDLFTTAFETNEPAMLDWVQVKMELKKLRGQVPKSCHCAPDQGGPCSSCMEAKHNL